MATGHVDIATGDALSSSRAHLNTELTELNNLHRGAAEPTNKVDGMLWLDTSTNAVKIYYAAGAAWRVVVNDYTVAQAGIAHLTAANTFTLVQTGVAATGASHFVISSQISAMRQINAFQFTFANASANYWLMTIPVTGRYAINSIYLISDTATTGSGAGTRWDFQVANLTAGNNLLSVAKTTNGAEIAADTPYSLGVNQNNAKADLDALDVLELQITKTGTPTDLSGAKVMVQVNYTVDLF